MEARDTYMTPEQFAEREQQAAGIEGLAELRAAIRDWDVYQYRSAEYLAGDGHERPVAPAAHIGNLMKQYPRAAAYVKADAWASSADFAKARLGRFACVLIAAGADHDEVLEKMEADYAAFKLAQEG